MSKLKLIIKNSIFKKLWNHLSKRRKIQFYLILILIIVSSLSEIISLGAVLPFLGALSSPDQLFQHPFIQPIIQFFELTKPKQLIPVFTIFFIIVVLSACLIRLLLLYTMIKFSNAVGLDISVSIYRSTLYQKYSIHLHRNSSEVIDATIVKTNTVIDRVLRPILIIISSTIIIIGIMSMLLIVNTFAALSAFITFTSLYLIVAYYSRTHLKNNSKIIAKKSIQLIKSVQEGLGGIRDIIINRTQQFYYKLYQNTDQTLRRATGNNMFVAQSPRYVMEAFGIIIIVILAYMITMKENGIDSSIPILGVIAFGAQRLLPLLQLTYSSYTSIISTKKSFEDVIDLLNQPLPEVANQLPPKPIQFERELELRNLSFRYGHDLPWVLKNVNLLINKGDRIGFVGESGSGKSTLLDIIMGLLSPTNGEMTIDNKKINTENLASWQVHIAHVPQSVYLSDESIQKNIAFGIPDDQIDEERIKKVAKEAQITTLIEQSKKDHQTFVGEQGVRLSGGQLQRIGIARALYKKADFLIFDEATSALDSKTELKIMDAIISLNRQITVLIIAHRLTTLKNCNKIIKLNQDQTITIGTYQELINN